jgi:hypothetical protein
VIVGVVYFYTSKKYESVSVGESNNSSEEVDNIDEAPQQQKGKSTYNSQQEQNEGRTATLEYNEYIEKGVVPNGWVEKSIKLEDGKIMTFIVPVEYQSVVYAEVVNRPIDSKPENEDLKYIGGSVFDIEKYERFYGGETKKIVHYWYVTSTNYKWNVHELDLGNSMHLELSYTYKSEADNPKIDKYLMDSIAGSVKIR